MSIDSVDSHLVNATGRAGTINIKKLQLKVDTDGNLSVVDFDLGNMLANTLARGNLKKINTTVRDKLKEKLPQGWVVDKFGIVNGNIQVSFRKE